MQDLVLAVVVLDIKEYNKVYSNYHLYENAKEKA
jgi:hypothetical protein